MQERVQLNISVSREQKLALQALAEGHGTSVTKLVLGLIDVPAAAAVIVPEVIKTPADAERVVEALQPKKPAKPVDEHVVDKSVPGWEMAELRRRAGWVKEECRCVPGTAGRCAHCRETGMRRAGLGRFGGAPA